MAVIKELRLIAVDGNLAFASNQELGITSNNMTVPLNATFI